MKNKVFLTILLCISSFFAVPSAYADRDCTSLGASDYNTFKEYCYKITDSYLDFRNSYEVNQLIDSYTANKMLDYAEVGLNYLPDSLSNKNHYNKLKTAVEKGIKDPEDKTVFNEIKRATEGFLNNTTIQEVEGKIDVDPATGNAPLTVTLRANVEDPTGTKLENYNYTWWIQDGTRRKILGNRVFLNYTFREEGNYAVFLDVTSNHRNKQGNIDVLSFSEKVMIKVNEKVASTIIRVNSKSLGGGDIIKFTPEEGAYGLLIDATSSTPASGTKFVQTEWDFGNGQTKVYKGAPRVERVIYAVEGEYKVKMKIKTNSDSIVERNFEVVVRNPIASIKANSYDGFLGDKFTFTADTYVKDTNLTYAWEIVDLTKDAIIFNKAASTFSYNFPEKGRFNVKLTVTAPSGEMDYDNRIVYINSRPPVANFTHKIENSTQPNRMFFDGGASYDLDSSDAGKLEYNWIINGDRVELDDSSSDGSSGYYTFPSIGKHDVVLQVLDPDDMMDQKSQKVSVQSILGVNFYTFPRVTQAGSIVKFVAEAPEAEYFEWRFGDGTTEGSKNNTMTYKYKESGIYDVSLTVRDANENTNNITKKMYVGDADRPLALLEVTNSKDPYGFDPDACSGKGAYVIDRVKAVKISAANSIDVTGKAKGLSYSWKIGDKYYTKDTVSKKFDELGCVPIKLTIRSLKSGKTDTKSSFIKVENLKPKLSSLDIQVQDSESDPVVVTVNAVGAKDPDGVIQSYLWYYYTDAISEPQDFRATRLPSTTFVLPKITGNYYFVVVMKDNNEERVKSEDITSRYFITLAGDNTNTPIVDLQASDTSIATGEEVTFTVTARNILAQDVLKDSKISWDFDGDGFYDKETKKGTITHKYTKAGEDINAKVKVSHKGFSNTRSVQINVSNVLFPDFEYVSIGNDVIFFNRSSGSIDEYVWDLGDGNTVTNNGSFKYSYTDGKTSHIVKLKVIGGGESKETSKEVVRNFKNLIASRKQEVGFYSDLVVKDGIITVGEPQDTLSLYVKSNKSEAKNYAIDYDTSSDSDLNGGDDDDYDNKNDASFYSGGPILLPLNGYKEQNIRVMVLDEAGNIISSKNIKVVKSYIEADPIKPEEIKFDNVPDDVKSKFEQIKNMVLAFPKEYKIQGLEYVQRLQEEWNDKRAKTQIIIEFEGFIAETGVDSSGDLTNLLESLLASDGGGKKSIAANALKNLLPNTISCPESLQGELSDSKICYDILVAKIQAIQESNDPDLSKQLAQQVLAAVQTDKQMTNKEKVDFKAILKTLVYGGVENIPPEEKKQVQDETKNGKITPPGETSQSSNGIMSTILSILTWIFYIILIIGLLIGLLYLAYKFLNKDSDKSFTDFISDKTSKKSLSSFETKTEVEDILADSEVSEEAGYDPLADFSKSTSTEKVQENKKSDFDWATFSQDTEATPKKVQQTTPDWLKGAAGEGEQSKKDVTVTEKKETVKIEKKVVDTKADTSKGNVPDWLKGTVEESENTKKDDIVTEKKETIKTEKKVVNTKADIPKGNVPDWLKGTMDEGEQTKKDVAVTEKKETVKTEKKVVETKTETPKGNVPDWLKGAVEEGEETKKSMPIVDKKENEKKERIPEVVDAKPIDKKKDDALLKKSGVPDWLKQAPSEPETQTEAENVQSVQKKPVAKAKVEKQQKVEAKEEIEQQQKPKKKQQSKSVQKDKQELPKTKDTVQEEPKLETKEELEEFIKIDDTPISAGKDKASEIPDWLHGENTEKESTTPKKQLKKNKPVVAKKETNVVETKKEEKVEKVDKKKSAPKKKQASKKVVSTKKEKEDFNDFDFTVTKGTKKNKNIEKEADTAKSQANTQDKIKQKNADTKKAEPKKASTDSENKKSDELWDDGMKIPDWLKND